MSKEYKKFGELTRDEQLELINHVLDGGRVEMYREDREKWYNVQDVNKTSLCFHSMYPYRKIKTELETLKEEYEKIGKKIKELEGVSQKDSNWSEAIRNFDGKTFEVNASGVDTHPFEIGGAYYSSDQFRENFTKIYNNN